MMRGFVMATTAVGAMLCGTRAEAQQVVHRQHTSTGMEFSVAGGVGGFVNDSSTAFTNQQRGSDHAYWPGYVMDGAVSGRLMPWLAIGGHFQWQYSAARDLPMGTTAGHLNMISYGAFVRIYAGTALGWQHFDPWFGVGVEPMNMLWAEHDTPAGQVWSRVSAFGMPIHVGLDYRFNEILSVGAFANLTPWLPYEACRSQAPNGDMTCTTSNLASNTYFSAMANLKVRLPW